MKKKIITEEYINNFNRLSGLLIEQNMGAFLTKFVGAITKTPIEDDVIANLTKAEERGVITFKNNRINSLTLKQLTDDELSTLFKSRAVRAAYEDALLALGKNVRTRATMSVMGKDYERYLNAYDGKIGSRPFIRQPGKTTTEPTTKPNNPILDEPFGPKKPLIEPENFSKMNPQSVEETLQKFRTGYRDFIPFEQQVDLIPGFNQTTKNYVKLNFLKSQGKIIEELRVARSAIREANLEKYGSFGRVLNKIMNKPLKSALWTASALAAYFIIKTSVKVYNRVDAGTSSGFDWLDKKTGYGQPTTQPTPPVDQSDPAGLFKQ